MEKTVSVRFTRNDIDMLKNIRIPPNPCTGCYDGKHGACCGCLLGRKYDEEVKPYKDAGIYEIALKVLEASNILKQQKELERKRLALLRDIPDFIGGNMKTGEMGNVIEEPDPVDEYFADLVAASKAAKG